MSFKEAAFTIVLGLGLAWLILAVVARIEGKTAGSPAVVCYSGEAVIYEGIADNLVRSDGYTTFQDRTTKRQFITNAICVSVN